MVTRVLVPLRMKDSAWEPIHYCEVDIPGGTPPSEEEASRATYSFPAPCWLFTRRVARSMQTIKHPVTLGSRVPECRVRSTRSMRFSHATTSWEDGFEGLSRLMTPEEI
jgi:hypothetical protein